MPKPSNSAYSDEVSDDEQAELDRLMKSNEAPEEDNRQLGATDDDGEGGEGGEGGEPGKQPDAAAVAAAAAAAAAAEKAKEGEGGDDGQQAAPGADGLTEDQRIAAFLEKHKGKSPEELARLAYQQNQRASKAEFDSRKVSDTLKGTLDRIQTARNAAIASAEAKRAAFKEKLEKDPDAALLEARTAQLSDEERAEMERFEQAEFTARAEAAVAFASAVIPNYEARAPQIRSFGMELGFREDELAQVVDGRQIVTLHLADIAGNLIKAGVIDASGRFLQLPKPVEEIPAGGGGQQQGRSGFGRQPARGAGTQKSLNEQLQDINNLSDAELDKLDPAVLEALLRAAEVSE